MHVLGPASPRRHLSIVPDTLGDRRNDVLRHLLLNGEYVLHRSVVTLGPQMCPARGLNKLHGDAHPIAQPPNASFHDILRSQHASDLTQVHALSAKSE